MNTNIISAPSKVSNVIVLSVIFLLLAILETILNSNYANYIVGAIGIFLAVFIAEKNTAGLKTSLVACFYSAWYLTGFSWVLFIPVILISLSLAFPQAKPLTYYTVNTLLFAYLNLTFKLVGSMERGLDILWSSILHIPAGPLMILIITVIYASRIKATENKEKQKGLKRLIKSASSTGLVIGSTLGGLLTGLFLATLTYNVVYS